MYRQIQIQISFSLCVSLSLSLSLSLQTLTSQINLPNPQKSFFFFPQNTNTSISFPSLSLIHQLPSISADQRPRFLDATPKTRRNSALILSAIRIFVFKKWLLVTRTDLPVVPSL